MGESDIDLQGEVRPTSSLRGESEGKLPRRSALWAVFGWCLVQVGWLLIAGHATLLRLCREYLSQPNGRGLGSEYGA